MRTRLVRRLSTGAAAPAPAQPAAKKKGKFRYYALAASPFAGYWYLRRKEKAAAVERLEGEVVSTDADEVRDLCGRCDLSSAHLEHMRQHLQLTVPSGLAQPDPLAYFVSEVVQKVKEQAKATKAAGQKAEEEREMEWARQEVERLRAAGKPLLLESLPEPSYEEAKAWADRKKRAEDEDESTWEDKYREERQRREQWHSFDALSFLRYAKVQKEEPQQPSSSSSSSPFPGAASAASVPRGPTLSSRSPRAAMLAMAAAAQQQQKPPAQPEVETAEFLTGLALLIQDKVMKVPDEKEKEKDGEGEKQAEPVPVKTKYGRPVLNQEAKLAFAWKVADADADGLLSQAELSALLGRMIRTGHFAADSLLRQELKPSAPFVWPIRFRQVQPEELAAELIRDVHGGKQQQHSSSSSSDGDSSSSSSFSSSFSPSISYEQLRAALESRARARVGPQVWYLQKDLGFINRNTDKWKERALRLWTQQRSAEGKAVVV